MFERNSILYLYEEIFKIKIGILNDIILSHLKCHSYDFDDR